MTSTTRKAALALGETQYFTGKPCVNKHVANRRTKTGECMDCRAAFLIEWRAKNPIKVKQHNATQYANHFEKLIVRTKNFNAENKEKVQSWKRRYQKQNPHIFAKIGAKRRAAKLQRTPAWLTDIDHERIGNEYKLAALLTKVTGSSWHVDHIIPLQGKMVSGLHVPSNLRVLPATENIRKSNFY
jgi:hypothetical protein